MAKVYLAIEHDHGSEDGDQYRVKIMSAYTTKELAKTAIEKEAGEYFSSYYKWDSLGFFSGGSGSNIEYEIREINVEEEIL